MNPKIEVHAQKKLTILIWIICLACLSVGARNFEQGLSGDGPLYSNIARNIVRSGDWFRLHAGVPDFNPYAEHPHLGFWIVASVFTVLPAADWSARIPGHFFYILFLWTFFLFIRYLSNERVALFTILLLWIWARFSNPFSNVFLDPAALFFGSSSVMLWLLSMKNGSRFYAFFSGVFLALCVMTKGIMALGFVPGHLIIGLYNFLDDGKVRSILLNKGMLLAGFVLSIGAYFVAVNLSSVPDFFFIYWTRQMTERFNQIWSLRNVVESEFWWKLLRQTHFLAPLCFIGFRNKNLSVLIAATLLASFILMYAGGLRSGGQYWLTILPWIAWLAAEGLSRYLPGAIRRWMVATASISVLAMFLIQYLPVATHGMRPSADEIDVEKLSAERDVQVLYMDWAPTYVDFINSCRYAWYGDVQVEYVRIGQPVPLPEGKSAYLLYRAGSMLARGKAVGEAGWCLYKEYEERSIWLACLKK